MDPKPTPSQLAPAPVAHTPLVRTPLHAAHLEAGGRMTPFAGYDMPVQYEGVLAEHRWTRTHAGLFDVSHMGPAWLRLARPSGEGEGEADHRAVAALVEPLVCGDLAGLRPGQLRYTLMLNADGGVVDDLIVGRPVEPARQGWLYIVVNAGTKDDDFARIIAAAGAHARLARADDGGLIALQGPQSAEVARGLWPEAAALGFMRFSQQRLDGEPVTVSRSGYTGEDGFEILTTAAGAPALWARLMADPRVRPVGLGARDSLRLEAGLPLYGHDLDDTVSPVEADLAFALSRRRLRTGDMAGAARIARELQEGPARVRVGLRILARAPAREGAVIADAGRPIGQVTSGGFSPTLSAPIAMGFVPLAYRAVGTAVQAVVRDRALPAEVVALPFVAHRYVRHPAQTPAQTPA